MKPRLLVVASHPIQYHAPWFRALHAAGEIDLEVLFLALPDAVDQGVGFGRAFEWDVPLLDGYAWRKAQTARGGITGSFASLSLSGAAKDLQANRYDAILVTGWHKLGMLQALRAAVRSGCPTLVRAESNGLAPLSWLRRAKGRLLLRGVQSLLPIGKGNRRFYERLGIEDRVGPTVPYFVDNGFFAERAELARARRDEIRRKFGVPAAATCFLFAGKFEAKKRPGDVLKALAALHAEYSSVHVLMVGSGELESELKRTVAEGDLPVSFAGFLNQSEISAAYAAADCLVLPSDYGETWGLVVNEGMACGLPAIVSNRVGSGPDLVVPGATGFMFDYGDIQSLCAAMRAFITLPGSERAKMGAEAQRLVGSGYSIAAAVRATLRAVTLVAERRT